MKNKICLTYIKYIILLVCSISLCSQTIIIDEYASSNLLSQLIELFTKGLIDSPIIGLTIFFAVFIIIKKSENIDPDTTAKAISFLFTLFVLFGNSYKEYNSWIYIFKDIAQLIYVAFIGLGFYFFFNRALLLIFSYMDNTCSNITEDSLRFINRFSNIFLIIILCWIPFLLVFYPGSVPHDGYYQLNMAYGIDAPSNHHPWFSTLVIRFVTSIGMNISDNFGVFFYIICQTLFCASVFTILCVKINRYHIPNIIKYLSCGYYAVFPVWGSYTQTLMKDVIYYALFALFFFCYLEIIESKSLKSGKEKVIFIIITSLTVLYRNEAIYIILPSLVILFVIIKSKAICTTIIFTMIVFCLFKSFILPSMNVAESSKREMLSIPFQQTARYATIYKDEMTTEEISVIDKIIDFDTIVEKYNPLNADAVKNTYKRSSREEKIEYIKVYIYEFFKHPTVYIQALLNSMYGYVYPGLNQETIADLQFYIKGEPIAKGNFDINYVNNQEIRDIMKNYAFLWYKIPGVSMLMYTGTYTWALIICFGALFRKKQFKMSCVFVPIIVTILICFISPVNGYLRYMLPVMAVFPLFSSFTLHHVRHTDLVSEI